MLGIIRCRTLKCNPLAAPKPAKKGQVYFGRFYLGKRWRSPGGEDAVWVLSLSPVPRGGLIFNLNATA